MYMIPEVIHDIKYFFAHNLFTLEFSNIEQVDLAGMLLGKVVGTWSVCVVDCWHVVGVWAVNQINFFIPYDLLTSDCGELINEVLRFALLTVQVIYEDISDISQLNDKMRSSELPNNSPLITRLVHYHK